MATDQLRHALHVLYSANSGDAGLRKAADEYLQKFLYSTECWLLSLELIQLPDATASEQLFCARALHVRLRCSVSKPEKKQASHEVMSTSEWEATRNVLVGLAQRWAAVPDGRPVLTQICSAIAALAAKMEAWPTADIVQDLAAAFSSSGASAAMAEVLCALPEEIASRQLKIHPQRREQVKLALAASAPVALQVMDALWEGAGADSRMQLRVVMSLAAWLDGGLAAPEQTPSSKVLAQTFALLGGGLSAAHPLVQHPDCLPVLLEAASAASGVLSPKGEAPAGFLLQLLAPIPCAPGAAARGCCAAGLALLSRAAVDLLPGLVGAAELMLRLLEATERGLPGSLRGPVPALQPWTAAREVWDGAGEEWRVAAKESLRGAALRLAEVGVGRMRVGRAWAEADGEEEEEEEEGEWRGEGGRERRLRDEVQEGMRDAAALVGAEPMVEALLVELARLLAAGANGGEGAGGAGGEGEEWVGVEAVLAGVYGVGRLLPPASPLLPPLFALTAQSVGGRAPHPLVLETGAWVVAGSCKSLRAPTALPEASLDAAVGVVYAALGSSAEGAVRAGAVAFMKVCEQAGAAMWAKGRAVQGLATFAAEGPPAPHPSQLRLGQEPVNLIVLRGLLAMAAAAERREEGARVLSELQGHVAASLARRVQAAAQGGLGPEAEELVMCEAAWECRKTALLLRAARSAGGSAGELRALVEQSVPWLAQLCGQGQSMGRGGVAAGAAEVCGAMLECSADAEGGEGGGAGDIEEQLYQVALGGLARGGLGGGEAWLTMLGESVRRAGAGRGGGRGGAYAVEGGRMGLEMARGTGPGLVGSGVGKGLMAVLKECVACRVPGLAAGGGAALGQSVGACVEMLQGSKGEECAAALDLAAELLLSPFKLRDRPQGPGGGSLGADSAWEGAVQAVMVEGRGGVAVVQGLLQGAGGALPACHVTDVASSLYRFWVGSDRGPLAQRWLLEAVQGYSAAGRMASDKTQQAFLAELTSEVCAADLRKFKRCLKAFCGGKKKGGADTPSPAPSPLASLSFSGSSG